MTPWPTELWFYTPRGLALVLACQPCGIHGDMEWTVVIADSGEIWNYKNHEIRVARNLTYGINPAGNLPQQQKENKSMSIGEDRVRTKFNPSAESAVDQIKQKTAELIDLCEALKVKEPRLASLAQTDYESAAMWAVKAATAEPK